MTFIKKKFDVAEKREYDELNQMADIAYKLPASDPRRAKAIEFVQSEYGKFRERVDIPPQVMRPEDPLIAIVDWASGIGRSVVGEGAKAIKSISGGKLPSGGVDQILKAAASPYFGPAKGTGEYLKELDVPKGTSLAETSLGRGMGIAPGSTFDISPRGAAGFVGDVASGNFWKLAGKAGDKLLGTAAKSPEKFLSGIEATAAAQRKKQADFLAAMNAKKSGTPQSAARSAAVAVNETIKGGPRYLGQSLYESRFADIDQKNIEAGKLPVSGVMMESGGWGGYQAQIVQDMRAVLDEKSKAMAALVSENAINPVRASELFEKFYKDADVQKALANPATSEAAKNAIKEVEEMFAQSIANNPNTIPGYRGALPGQEIDPTIRRMHNISSGVVTDLETRLPGNPNFPKVDVVKDPRFSTEYMEMFGSPVKPNVENFSLDALDPIYTGEQLQGLKSSFQNEAFNRGAYSSKDIANAADRTKNEMARLAMTKMGHYAGEALEGALESPYRPMNQASLYEKVPVNSMRPPVGAEYAKLNQEIASILTAAPSVATQVGGGVAIPWTNYSTGDLFEAAKIPVARTLMSGPAQYAPSVWRAVMLNRRQRNKEEDPYYPIRRIGGE